MSFFRHLGKQKKEFIYSITFRSAGQLESDPSYKEGKAAFCVCSRNKRSFRTKVALIEGGEVRWNETIRFTCTLYRTKKEGTAFDDKFFGFALKLNANSGSKYDTKIDLAEFAQAGLVTETARDFLLTQRADGPCLRLTIKVQDPMVFVAEEVTPSLSPSPSGPVPMMPRLSLNNGSASAALLASANADGAAGIVRPPTPSGIAAPSPHFGPKGKGKAPVITSHRHSIVMPTSFMLDTGGGGGESETEDEEVEGEEKSKSESERDGGGSGQASRSGSVRRRKVSSGGSLRDRHVQHNTSQEDDDPADTVVTNLNNLNINTGNGSLNGSNSSNPSSKRHGRSLSSIFNSANKSPRNRGLKLNDLNDDAQPVRSIPEEKEPEVPEAFANPNNTTTAQVPTSPLLLAAHQRTLSQRTLSQSLLLDASGSFSLENPASTSASSAASSSSNSNSPSHSAQPSPSPSSSSPLSPPLSHSPSFKPARSISDLSMPMPVSSTSMVQSGSFSRANHMRSMSNNQHDGLPPSSPSFTPSSPPPSLLRSGSSDLSSIMPLPLSLSRGTSSSTAAASSAAPSLTRNTSFSFRTQSMDGLNPMPSSSSSDSPADSPSPTLSSVRFASEDEPSSEKRPSFTKGNFTQYVAAKRRGFSRFGAQFGGQGSSGSLIGPSGRPAIFVPDAESVWSAESSDDEDEQSTDF